MLIPLTLTSRVKEIPLLKVESLDDILEELVAAIPESVDATPIIYSPSLSYNDPPTFEDFIGQDSPKEVLIIIVEAALKRGEYIPNILLTGMFGHGKTTLAKLIATKLKVNTRLIDGVLSETLFKNPNPNMIYIIDEIHNIPPVVADSLNILLDSKQLHIIGCTTSPGKLSAPFRSRFRQMYLEEYTEIHIKQILSRASNRAKIDITDNSLNLLSSRAKLNPRNALTLLDFVKESAIVKEIEQISEDLIHSSLKSLKVDDLGLTEIDRVYLNALNYTKPVGLRHISSVLSLDIVTIEEQVEPFLLKIGLIERTARGRLRLFSE